MPRRRSTHREDVGLDRSVHFGLLRVARSAGVGDRRRRTRLAALIEWIFTDSDQTYGHCRRRHRPNPRPRRTGLRRRRARHQARRRHHLSTDLAGLAVTGSCFDNAFAKSFNASLKVERVHRTTYPTREHARKGVTRYIEVRNNTKRLHSALGYRTPEEIHDEYRNQQVAARSRPITAIRKIWGRPDPRGNS
jgi:putative transposase